MKVLYTKITQIYGMLVKSLFLNNSAIVKQKDANAIKDINFVHIHHVKMVKMDIRAIKKIVLKNLFLSVKTEIINLLMAYF